MGSSFVLDVRRPSEPDPDDVRRQLVKMLASKTFANASRLSKFLKYGVEAALAGHKPVNEYSIGIDVFGRDPSFDPRIDPVVRVHARRLRAGLARYYETEGSQDLIEIQLPLRTYIPCFQNRKLPRPKASHPLRGRQDQHVRCSVAVFPFKNLSPEGVDDYFVEGLTSEVIHSLARIKDWRVVSWTAETRRAEIHEIAAQLGVQAALFGTVRKTEKKLRISAELIAVPGWTVLWSQVYAVEMNSLITTEEKIARAICRALSCEFDVSIPSASSNAFRLYMKGRYGCVRRDQRSFARSVEYLQRATAVDPEYGPSHAALAEARVLMALYAEARPHEVMPAAKFDAQRALEQNFELADAHTALALVKAFYYWDSTGAEADFLRAVEMAPSSASALQWYAVGSLIPQGRYDEAIAHLRRAQNLDPLMLTIPNHLAYAYCAAGSPDIGLDQLYEYLDIEPDYPLTHWSLGLLYVAKSEHHRAIDEFEIAATLSSQLSYAMSSLAHAYALAGDIKRASAMLEELVERSRARYVPAIDLALASFGLKRYDDVLGYLGTARAERCAWLLHAKVDSRFRSLLTDPRFRTAFELPQMQG